MAETSGPFDTGGWNEDQWAPAARLWAPSCVEEGSGCLVSAVSGFQTQVAPGNAFVRGFGYNNSTAKSLTHSGAPGTSGQSRIDLVVLHLDRTANTVTAQIVTGVAAPTASAVAPAPTQNDTSGIWELPLATVQVNYGATSVGTITDVRNQYSANDTGWTQSGMVIQSGWTIGSPANCAYRKVGRRVDVRFRATKTGSTIGADNSGNMTDTAVLIVPAGFRPPSNYYTIFSVNAASGMAYMGPSGVINLADMYPNQIVAAGTDVFGNFSYWLD